MSLRPEDEAAARLGVKPNTLAKWRMQGRGPRFVKIGRLVRYDDADIDAFLEQSKRSSTLSGSTAA